MEQIADMQLNEFLNALKEKSPTPGGGSASAITAATAAALLSMSANYTVGNEKYPEFQNGASEVLEDVTALIEELKALATADVMAFQGYSDISALKRDTEEEKKLRAQMMQNALIDCMNVPLQIAEISYKLLNLALKLSKQCNPNLLSDVLVANEFSLAALNSAIANVKINLKYLRDESAISFANKRLAIFDNKDILYQKTSAEINAQFGF